MNRLNPSTGKRDRATELVVHLTYAGKAVDVPMRDRQNERQPDGMLGRNDGAERMRRRGVGRIR